MNPKFLLPLLISIFLLAAILISFFSIKIIGDKSVCDIKNPAICTSDDDCVCYDTGCFLGNKNFYNQCVNKSQQCYDFCTGWGQKPVKCVNGECRNSY